MHQPGSHRRKVTQDFSSTFLLAVHAFIFFIVDREVELCVLTIESFYICRAFFYFFYFFYFSEEKIK